MPAKKKSARAKTMVESAKTKAAAPGKPAAPAKSVKRKVSPIPPGLHTLTPHLVCAGASDAIAFYKKAFGAEEITRLASPDGKLMHAAIRIGDSTVMLNDEFPHCGAFGPLVLKGSSVTLHLYVADADAAFARAIKAGATVRMPMADMFWGDRYGIITDPFGHHWSLAHPQRILTPEQIAAAAAKCFS